jgi:hypothetical protein
MGGAHPLVSPLTTLGLTEDLNPERPGCHIMRRNISLQPLRVPDKLGRLRRAGTCRARDRTSSLRADDLGADDGLCSLFLPGEALGLCLGWCPVWERTGRQTQVLAIACTSIAASKHH